MQLYNLMRPNTFGGMLPTCNTISAILNDVEKRTLKHTYLLHGPRGCGKSTMAKLIAHSYDCESIGQSSTKDIPCGTCGSCKRNKSSYTNIVSINGRSHGVDKIKELIHDYKRKGLFEGTVIIVIDEAHLLTEDAKNQLLEITENPPKHLKWILTSTRIDRFRDDLISRCQTHMFNPLGVQDTIKLVTTAVDVYNNNLGKVDGNVNTTDLGEKIYNATGGVPRLSIGMVESYLASNMNEATISHVCEEEDDKLTPSDRERFNDVLQIITSNDIIQASKTAYKLCTFSGNVEGIRLGLMKYCFNRLAQLKRSESDRATRGIQLLNVLREPLNDVYPMRDLLARLLSYVHGRG